MKKEDGIVNSSSLLRTCAALTSPPCNDSDTTLLGSANLTREDTLQDMAERQNSFDKDDELRWHAASRRKGFAS